MAWPAISRKRPASRAIDLEESAGQNNLSYYLTLRALNDSGAIAQALGINRIAPDSRQ